MSTQRKAELDRSGNGPAALTTLVDVGVAIGGL